MKRLLSFLFNKSRKYQGDKYVGDFKDGKKDGFGTYTWANGDEYGGQFKDDKRDGVGVYTYANGDKYGGIWKDDKKDGEGTYIWANKDKLKDKKKTSFFKNLLITKKTVTQDKDDPCVEWVESDLYNPYEDRKDKTIHWK